jgi:serine/threonine protein kinase/WD40 repeat protein
MSVDAKRVQTVFLAAVEPGDPAQQAAFLDRECASDPELRRRVEALLQAHRDPASVLDRPAVTPRQDRSWMETTDLGSFADCEGGKETLEPISLGFLEPSPQPGALGRIGHYEVLEVLGRGGFGIVLRAQDEALQRVVAVKVLAPQMAATSPARKRFLREARSYAAIRHENVVQVHAVEEQPLPYLVMEFIPGETLQQRLDRTGPLDVPEILRIGRQIAEGLAAAHETGLIHRDVKPANVLIEGGPQQRVKLTDFGLARAADDASISQSGLVAGTPLYMAPEQAKGEALDHRADLFSFGSVLYVMCTGRPPFRANGTMAILKRVCEDTPRPIHEIIPETPVWLSDLITRLHAKKPADRFQSAREVADLLQRYQNDMATHGKVVSVPAPPAIRKWSRSIPLVAAAAAVLGVLVFSALWWSRPVTGEPASGSTERTSWRPRPSPAVEELARTSSPFDALDRKDLPKDALTRVFGVADKAPPELVALLDGNPFRLPRPERTSWFAQDREGKWLAVPCDNELVLFNLRTPAAPKVLGATAGRIYQVAFSPDGKRLAVGSWSGGAGAVVWDVETGEEKLRLKHEGDCLSIQFSPDGTRLLTVFDDHIPVLWDAQSGEAIHPFPVQEQPVCADVTFTADGKQIVTHTRSGGLTVWDAETGKEIRPLVGPERVIEDVPDWLHFPLAVSPDGNWLAAGSPSGFKVWATATWKEQFVSPPTPATWLAFTPDGRTILTGPHDCAGQRPHTVTLWDTQTGHQGNSATLRSQGPWAVYHLSTDGKTLYAMACDPAEPSVHVYNAATLEEQILPGHVGRVGAVDVSPDGAWIASAGADGTVRLWDVRTRRVLHTIPRWGKTGVQVVFSPDGKTLYAAWSEDGVILVIDPTNGQRRELGIYGPQLQCLALSPDARLLAAAGEGGVRLWALPGGTPRGDALVVPLAPGAIAFSPDAKTLAVGGQDSLRLFELATWRLVRTLEFLGAVRWVGFRPDGRSVAVAGEPAGSPVLLFDVSTGARPLRLEGNESPLLKGAWRADGGLLATVEATGGAVQLWDFAHAVPKRGVLGATAPNAPGIEAVAFSPEGRHVVTANADGTISVLRLAGAGEAYRVP